MSPETRLAPPSTSPARPSSRSRSRDSARSSLLPGTLTPAVVTPESDSLGAQEPSDDDLAPLPAFLRQSRTGRFPCDHVHTKWIDLEWQQRHRFANVTGAAEWARPQGDDVRERNRYANVDPYANNRIHLRVAEEGHSDYINASPVVLRSTRWGTQRNYIAAQGPKDISIDHFWRMLWHETADPAVILMLTQTNEGGREKCSRYYPASLEEPTLVVNLDDELWEGVTGTVTLVALTEDPSTRSTIRELEFEVGAEQEKRKVWHMLFEGWPDHLVPEGDDRAALLRLIELSAARNAAAAPAPDDGGTRPGDSPRIVHCSAGVGRTGTFMALDWLLTELAEGALDEVAPESDPIVDVVERLRAQRMMMVQAEPQFWFLYTVMRAQWIHRWRERLGQPGTSPEATSEGGTEASMQTAPESPADRTDGDEVGSSSVTSDDERRATFEAALDAELKENVEAAEASA